MGAGVRSCLVGSMHPLGNTIITFVLTNRLECVGVRVDKIMKSKSYFLLSNLWGCLWSYSVTFMDDLVTWRSGGSFTFSRRFVTASRSGGGFIRNYIALALVVVGIVVVVFD